MGIHQVNDFEKYQGLIFDCDGTLADTMPLHWESWKFVASEFEFTFTEKRFYELGGVPSVKILKDIKHSQSKDFDPVKVGFAKEEKYLTLLDRVTPIEAVVEIARQFAGKKPMAVASGGTRDVISEVLDYLGILELFDSLVTCEDVDNQKPAPDIFLKAAAELKITPSECAGFEDSELGMEAIKGAGMDAYHVDSIKEFAP